MRRSELDALALLLGAILSVSSCSGQAVDVRAQIVLQQTHQRKASAPDPSSDVLVWLTPVNPPASFQPPAPGRFRMTQKNKSFEPRLLVIPLGSTVTFPNLDPFFHNVFSQFDGKRFDLGLYEAGSTRDVRFDHQGVSYIFCNIHPEMSAVIITVTSPWYAISSGGSILLKGVSPGTYEVHVWASGADARQLDALTHRVRIAPDADNLGTISIVTDGRPATHKNKFGDDYRPNTNPIY